MNGEILSTEIKVACEIVRLRELGEKAWFARLVETLDGKISKDDISKSLDTLFDWSVIVGSYGETTPGKAGRLLLISNEADHLIFELYNKYWK